MSGDNRGVKKSTNEGHVSLFSGFGVGVGFFSAKQSQLNNWRQKQIQPLKNCSVIKCGSKHAGLNWLNGCKSTLSLEVKSKSKNKNREKYISWIHRKKRKKRKKAVSTFKSHLKVYYLNSKIIIYLRAKHLITAAAFVVSANISDSCCDK